jgi:hypothetical protein
MYEKFPYGIIHSHKKNDTIVFVNDIIFNYHTGIFDFVLFNIK